MSYSLSCFRASARGGRPAALDFAVFRLSSKSDDEDYVRVPARRKGGRERRKYYDKDDKEDEFEGGEDYDDGEREGKYYDDWGDEDDDWDGEYEDEGDDEVEFDIDPDRLLEDVLVPNPLLDSIDPDGAADRFPELARDPRFWIDMALFIAFLNFISFAGPRDPFPDLPWY